MNMMGAKIAQKSITIASDVTKSVVERLEDLIVRIVLNRRDSAVKDTVSGSRAFFTHLMHLGAQSTPCSQCNPERTECSTCFDQAT